MVLDSVQTGHYAGSSPQSSSEKYSNGKQTDYLHRSANLLHLPPQNQSDAGTQGKGGIAAELDSQDRGQDQSCMPVTCGEFRQGKSSADTYFGNHYQYPGVPVSVEAGSGAEAKGETPHEIFGVQRAGESP
jgi:hypothetical protein